MLCRLSISPDSKLPKVVVGVAKNRNLVLCICDYRADNVNSYSEIDIGKKLIEAIGL